MKFTKQTKLVLDKIHTHIQSKPDDNKWRACGYTVSRDYREWELILLYGEDIATMTFRKSNGLSEYEFEYVADSGSKEYEQIQEIVDVKLEPIIEIMDEILMDEKREEGTLTFMDRVRCWWRAH